MKIYICDRNFSKFLLFRFEKNNQMHKIFQLDDGIDSYLEFIFEINQLTNKETPILYAAIHHKKWHQHFDMELEFVFFLFITNEFEVFRAQSHFDLIFHKNHFSWNRQKQPRLIMPSPYWTVSAWKNPFFVEIEKKQEH